jgi:hypothetical protein
VAEGAGPLVDSGLRLADFPTTLVSSYMVVAAEGLEVLAAGLMGLGPGVDVVEI